MMFTKAITRLPGHNYKDGLTTVDYGVPDYEKTLTEHRRYRETLRECGLQLIELDPDLRYPDGTFVEDTAIILTKTIKGHSAAILTNPGAQSRLGEVETIRPSLEKFFNEIAVIQAPGTLDGGDICEAGDHVFIGISHRTNEEGGRQLAAWLASHGYTSSFIDIRQTSGILHLKSGISYIGDHRLVVINSLASRPEFSSYELICVSAGEEYAANCIRVNDHVLIAAGFPSFEQKLRSLGYPLKVLDMSEFQKMDGGLSCLSLRF